MSAECALLGRGLLVVLDVVDRRVVSLYPIRFRRTTTSRSVFPSRPVSSRFALGVTLCITGVEVTLDVITDLIRIVTETRGHGVNMERQADKWLARICERLHRVTL